MMRTNDLDYQLPDDLIAQTPAEPRDSCRLMVLNRTTGSLSHRRFSDIGAYLKCGDLLVANQTKVMPARLLGQREHSGGEAELLLLQQLEELLDGSQLWEALVKPGRRLKPGAGIEFADRLRAEIVDWADPGQRGMRIVRLEATEDSTVKSALQSIGQIPLPPYITQYDGDRELYQTVYAQTENSAAAPTAGLHFTEELLEQLKALGIGFSTIELEVGLDTFRTISEEDPRQHQIHTERYSVDDQTISEIEATRAAGGRIIAVGTTSVRALESAWDEASSRLLPRQREQTSLYIMPGYQFKAIDALITNFHIPRSTLLLLVSAFATPDFISYAYQQAIAERYRFFSFGDAMLIE
jgi:S-adenosylmethionine:tRNA ribosyltransferase-isomerase